MYLQILCNIFTISLAIGIYIQSDRRTKKAVEDHRKLLQKFKELKGLYEEKDQAHIEMIRKIHELISKRHPERGADLTVISLDTMREILTDMIDHPREKITKKALMVLRKGVEQTSTHVIFQASGFSIIKDGFEQIINRKSEKKKDSPVK